MSTLDAILSMTDQVEAMIADGRWADASELETERRELIVRYVASEGKAAPGLRELYDRSVRSMNELQHGRRALAGDASQAISNSRAVDAYLENAASVRSGA